MVRDRAVSEQPYKGRRKTRCASFLSMDKNGHGALFVYQTRRTLKRNYLFAFHGFVSCPFAKRITPIIDQEVLGEFLAMTVAESTCIELKEKHVRQTFLDRLPIKRDINKVKRVNEDVSHLESRRRWWRDPSSSRSPTSRAADGWSHGEGTKRLRYAQLALCFWNRTLYLLFIDSVEMTQSPFSSCLIN